MKVKWSGSALSTSDYDKDVEFIKSIEKWCNERLKTPRYGFSIGFIFDNEILDALGIRIVKNGYSDGLLYDPLSPEDCKLIKFKIKKENGDIWISFDDEHNVIDDIFM